MVLCPILRAALAAKQRGNESYKQGKYRAAIDSYSQAICRGICYSEFSRVDQLFFLAALDPQAAYFNNRAAAMIMLLDFEAALKDAKEALRRDETNAKVKSVSR